MIIVWALDVIGGFFVYLLGTIPPIPVPTGSLTSFFEVVGRGARVVNGYFPIGTLGVCFGLIVGAQLALWLWNIVLMVVHSFWGSR